MKPHFTHFLSGFFALCGNLFVPPATGLAGEDTEYTIRRFDGTIGGDLKVSLELIRRGEGSEDEWSGSYFYLRHGEPISLTSYDPYEIGSYASGRISLVPRWKDILPDLKPGRRVHALAARRTGW